MFYFYNLTCMVQYYQIMERARIVRALLKKEKPYLKPHYPDFRFMCPGCGSLDVYLSGEMIAPKIHCLDCNTNYL